MTLPQAALSVEQPSLSHCFTSNSSTLKKEKETRPHKKNKPLINTLKLFGWDVIVLCKSQATLRHQCWVDVPVHRGGFGYVPVGLGGLSRSMLFWHKFMNPGASFQREVHFEVYMLFCLPSSREVRCRWRINIFLRTNPYKINLTLLIISIAISIYWAFSSSVAGPVPRALLMFSPCEPHNNWDVGTNVTSLETTSKITVNKA